LFGEDNTQVYHVAGLWHQNFYATIVTGKKAGKSLTKMMKKHAAKEKKATRKAERELKKSKSRSPMDPEEDDDDKDTDEDDDDVFEEGKPTLLWQNSVKDSTIEPYTRWGLSEFTVGMLKITEEMKAKLPASDARLRKDRVALEALDYDTAAKEKNNLEEAQRERRKIRETKNLTHQAKFFTKVALENGEEHWKFNTENSYWDQREKGFGANSAYDALDRPTNPISSTEKKSENSRNSDKEKDAKK